MKNAKNNIGGLGWATICPIKSVIAGSKGTWKIRYTIGSKEIGVGGIMKIVLPLMWSYPQFENPATSGYTEVNCFSEGIKLDFKIERYRYIILTVKEGTLIEGDKVEIIYGSSKESSNGESTAQWVSFGKENPATFEVKVKYVGELNFVSISGKLSVNITSGTSKMIEVFIPSYTKPEEEFEAKLVVKDTFGNAVENFKGTLNIMSTDSSGTFPKEISFSANNQGRQSFKASFKCEGIQKFYIKQTGTNLEGKSNPSKCNKKNSLNLYWGDIHGHTNLSDGAAPVDFYYKAARDITCFDFSSVTDHEYQGPHKFFDEEISIELTRNDWELIKKKTKEYYQAGRFVTFLGYEWTGRRDGVKDTEGDKNVYYIEDDMPIFSKLERESATSQNLWKILRDKNINALTIPHHTASGWHTLGSDLENHDPEFQPVIEIYSMHGNSEYSGNPRPLIKENNQGYAQNALEKGYRMGFVAGSDSHTLHLNVPNVPMGLPYLTLRFRGGITAIMAEELTRESLFDAIKKRRVYATTGERILIDFKINEYMMGEEIIFEGKAKIFGSIAGTDKLAKVELIKNNKVVYQIKPKGEKVEFSFEDIIQKDKAYFYYLRVTQNDSEMAWSSPIWIN
ncbi:hypothetical protein ES705_10192 [subsurface metagenome]